MSKETVITCDGSNTVAVVVPMYKERLAPEEEISYRHLVHFLGGHDKYLVMPDDLNATLPGFELKRFPRAFFRNTVSYSALLLSADFYQAFSAYKYILIYQLDALVFSDQLLEWCDRGWDYIGAPWIVCEAVDFVDAPTVGNGGFSLRRVSRFLAVTNSAGFAAELERYRKALSPQEAIPRDEPTRSLSVPQRITRRLGRFLGGQSDVVSVRNGDENFGINEDYFWSFKAANYSPGFKIATVEEALKFSFEVAPRECYALNNYQLPFGCHAWRRYDRKFWEPFLLK